MEKFTFTSLEQAQEIFYAIKDKHNKMYGFESEEDVEAFSHAYDLYEDAIMADTCVEFCEKYGWEHICDVEEYFENNSK